MINKTIQIINKLGLHARASAKLVQTTNRFESEIFLERDGNKVNAKSIMSVMMLAASQNTWLNLTVIGPDENSAFEAVTNLVSNYFGEEQ